LIEVVLCRVGVALSINQHQICIIASFDIVVIVDIGINFRGVDIGVGLLWLILYIKAALDFCPITIGRGRARYSRPW